ncbi:MAG: hypothetical protein PWQ37_2478 [Candidatus Petromonas sp.]|jgi:uncharacterized SAM-binding protein YcdF (DUF218 family)|nr:hypothetical protein [Candidatus Petromonas sp.]
MNIISKIIFTIFIILLLSFVIIEALIIKEANIKSKESSYPDDIDYMVVLGARLYGRAPSPALYERLEKAYEYAKDKKDLKIVVTGGQGENEDIPEAKAMKIFLVEKGIDKERIILEDKSTSTYENLKFARDILKKIDPKDTYSILIVTSDFHLLRAKLLAKRLGFKAYGLPAETPESIKTYIYLREYFAVIKSLIFD